MSANEFERIYLTLYDPDIEDEGPVWWVDERINGNDVEYVNAAAFEAQAKRIAELEAHLRHVIRWCEQDNSMLEKHHILTAVPRMCRDVLDKEAHDDEPTPRSRC